MVAPRGSQPEGSDGASVGLHHRGTSNSPPHDPGGAILSGNSARLSFSPRAGGRAVPGRAFYTFIILYRIVNKKGSRLPATEGQEDRHLEGLLKMARGARGRALQRDGSQARFLAFEVKAFHVVSRGHDAAPVEAMPQAQDMAQLVGGFLHQALPEQSGTDAFGHGNPSFRGSLLRGRTGT